MSILRDISWNIDDVNLDDAFLREDSHLPREERIRKLEDKLDQPLNAVTNKKTGLIEIVIHLSDSRLKNKISRFYTPEQLQTIRDLLGAINTIFNTTNPELKKCIERI